MSRNFVCNNVNGLSLRVREETLEWFISISDVVSGHCITVSIDKASFHFKDALTTFVDNSVEIDYSFFHEGQMLLLEYQKDIRMTKLTIEDRYSNSMYFNLTHTQMNILLDFVRYAKSDYLHVDDSFYLNIY